MLTDTPPPGTDAVAYLRHRVANEPSHRNSVRAVRGVVASHRPLQPRWVDPRGGNAALRSSTREGITVAGDERRRPPTHPEFGQLVVRLRTERGIAQRALATAAGVDASTISRVENGERGPVTVLRLK